MGVIVQREFTVQRDHRAMFERLSREGVWERMRNYGSQMIAFGTWAMGGPGDVMVTNSAYVDFDHWTATRAWGAYNAEQSRIDENRATASIVAPRPRLIEHSRAHVIEYDDELSEPAPVLREPGEAQSALPPTYGPQSVVLEMDVDVAPGRRGEYLASSLDGVWPWYREQGVRVIAVGHDPLKGPNQVTTMLGFRSIDDWFRLHGTLDVAHPADVSAAIARRGELVIAESSRLLMIATTFGEPA